MTSDNVLAGPPSDCCLKSVQHEGKAGGEEVKIADVVSYVSHPAKAAEKSHKRIILYFTDVFGPFYINNQLIMDYFSSHGWLVASPDYFEGDPIQLHRRADGTVEEGFDFQAWRTRCVTYAQENIPKWIEEVKTKYGGSGAKYTAVGYCFGAPYVFDQCAGDLISAGAVAHPSSTMESHIKGVKKPILFSCAETDNAFPPEKRHLAESVLAENKQLYHFQLFSGVSHGFAVKGDPGQENSKWAKEESAAGILRWFERFCN